MSGSYNDLDVPPTLTSFCIGVEKVENVTTNEFKKVGSKVVFLPVKMGREDIVNFVDLAANFEIIHRLIKEKKVLSVSTIKNGGIAESITKSAIGNKIGFEFTNQDVDLFFPYYGGFVIELAEDIKNDKFIELGVTTKEPKIVINENESLALDSLIDMWEGVLEKVFPTKVKNVERKAQNILSEKLPTIACKRSFLRPRVFIPVFPGTNCEYDIAKAFKDAGGEVKTVVFKNIKPEYIKESIDEFARAIEESQIIAIPGGFSSGDEPDGSGKFIASVFRNPKLKDLVKDGLILGICNGFQALVKLGLVPYGEIRDMDENSPTLTFNEIARHQSMIVNTKVVSKMSPWFSEVELGEEFAIPISHGEGRFVISSELEKELIENGQIATQYVDLDGNATYDIRYNPNGSIDAIEGITSPDGRVLGKMGHSERSLLSQEKNIVGRQDQQIFKAGIKYFK